MTDALKVGGVDATNQNKVDLKTNLGLERVNNTTDAEKPVSTLQATAIAQALTTAQNAATLAGTKADGAGTTAALATLTTAVGNKANTSDLASYQALSFKNAVNGYAGLDGTGKIASAQLPSYVDDVLEFANLAAFPGTGETSKVYTALDTNKIYRWGGSTYVEISPSPGSTDVISEGSVNKYYTDARALSLLTAANLIGLFDATVGNVVITQTGAKLRADLNWNGEFTNPSAISIVNVGAVVLRGAYNTDQTALKTRVTNLENNGGGGGTGPTSTDGLSEGTNNLYFTAGRVRTTPLTGIVFTSTSDVVATDTVLAAVGKLQAKFTAGGTGGGGSSPADVFFSVSVGDGTDTTQFHVQQGNFTDIFLANVSSISGGTQNQFTGVWTFPNGATYDPSNGQYTVNTAGRYLVSGTLRLKDGNNENFNLGFGIDKIGNSDSPAFFWNIVIAINGASRTTIVYPATSKHFAVGDKIRLFTYLDGHNADFSAGSLQIELTHAD